MALFNDQSTPPPPTDIPLDHIDIPDFYSIAAQEAKGYKDSGMWGAIWAGLAAGIAEILSAFLKFFFSIFSWLGVAFAKGIIEAEDKSQESFARLARVAIKDLFGVDPGDQFAQRGNAAGKNQAATAVGNAVIGGLFGALAAGGRASLEPSAAGAERYITTVVGLGLEGWLEGWVFEALSLGQLEKFADLDDTIASVLGLGRITNRIIGPSADILVGNPYKALLNRTYRPELLSPAQACRQFTRGRWTRERLDQELSVQGFSAERIEALINAQRKFLDVGELDHLVARKLWTREQAIQHLKDQGYTDETGAALLAIAENRRLDTFRMQWVNEALARFAAHDIDAVTWLSILSKSGLPEREQDMLRIVGGIKRELKQKNLTLSEVEQAVKRQIYDLNDFRAFVRDEGYSTADQLTLELLLLSEISQKAEADKAKRDRERERTEAAAARDAAAAARRAEIEEQLDGQAISLGKFESAVRAGVRSIAEYRQLLSERGYSEADQDTLAGLLAAGIEQRAADAARREELRRQAQVKRISLGDAETAVKRGVSTLDEYTQFLVRSGYGDSDRALLAGLLAAELQEAAEASRRREEAKAALALQQVSLDDVERAVRRGLRTIDDYRAFLDASGFAADDAGLLAELLQSELDTDAAARTRREEAARVAAVRNVNLSDQEKAVRGGLATITDYRAALARAGFTSDDLDLLARLLELDIESDKADAIARAEAKQRAAVRRISIDDLERAVKLGVVPITVYQDGLKRAGLPADDQQILTLSLAAELAAAKSAQDARARAAPVVKARGLSIAQFERSVRDGLRTTVEYFGFLLSQGFTQSDAQTLTALLELDKQQAAIAAARRAEIEAELAIKQLSLSQFERAVLGGVRRLDEYETFLRAQGYSALDIGTLVTLLRQKIEAAEEP